MKSQDLEILIYKLSVLAENIKIRFKSYEILKKDEANLKNIKNELDATKVTIKAALRGQSISKILDEIKKTPINLLVTGQNTIKNATKAGLQTVGFVAKAVGLVGGTFVGHTVDSLVGFQLLSQLAEVVVSKPLDALSDRCSDLAYKIQITAKEWKISEKEVLIQLLNSLLQEIDHLNLQIDYFEAFLKKHLTTKESFSTFLQKKERSWRKLAKKIPKSA